MNKKNKFHKYKKVRDKYRDSVGNEYFCMNREMTGSTSNGRTEDHQEMFEMADKISQLKNTY